MNRRENETFTEWVLRWLGPPDPTAWDYEMYSHDWIYHKPEPEESRDAR